ncbi:Ser/Thr protein kinase RdoA involved in Cpx stress response, MazF antagonist [Paenibacillus algorifonticola]|uniref:Ser/Thr protein kinase RdoA involved in Cpx stress response, MazF antagonist n=1 Tax=Paenibacillus algorifonticola TaxID=684063 RepID=A0A1I1YR85_9BACL|nr:phosphotransferase [Paenibacillus algorifonticola]SFE22105.1 Ser/Thr protein kinase RdoA involved in Cpx stress response, MazF antagonist [Paenibacillus algorifonticola]
MIKLKYLFNNTGLAEMLLQNWNYDADSLDLFRYYRISSNAIYPFRFEGNTRLLRFAPESEKNKANTLAELAFIAYLKDNGFNVMEAIASKQGSELVEAATPWGDYTASVFKRVPGQAFDQTDFNAAALYAYGQTLGQLHLLSSTYAPETHRRWSYEEVLDWIEEELSAFPEETAALHEAQQLRNYFQTWLVSDTHYGLIHYDFECDNVFYDTETGLCHVIDFDDAMYHWYAMDIYVALENLQEFIAPEDWEHKKQHFVDGYASEFVWNKETEAMLPGCKRFDSLYGYARVRRAMAETWHNEPEWMAQLRSRLEQSLKEAEASIGKEIE